MKTKSFPLILLATMLTVFAQAGLAAGQITFVPSPPPRNQGRQQSQQQGQQGLPPEKKKSLSKYGPEDVFPGAREQEDNTPRSTKKSSRQSSGTRAARSTPTPAPTPISTAIPAITPIQASASPTPARLAAVTPTAAPAAMSATGNRLTQSSANKPAPSKLVPAALGGASLLVLGALIYVVGTLRKRLREGR